MAVRTPPILFVSGNEANLSGGLEDCRAVSSPVRWVSFWVSGIRSDIYGSTSRGWDAWDFLSCQATPPPFPHPPCARLTGDGTRFLPGLFLTGASAKQRPCVESIAEPARDGTPYFKSVAKSRREDARSDACLRVGVCLPPCELSVDHFHWVVVVELVTIQAREWHPGPRVRPGE